MTETTDDAQNYNLDACMFAACQVAISTEETRPYLQGVYVQPALEGVLMTATDGRMMVVCHDKLGTAEKPVIIRIKGLQARAWDRLMWSGNPKEIALRVPNDMGTTFKHIVDLIEGFTYPDFTRVLPDYPLEQMKIPHEPIGSGYLGLISRVAALITRSQGNRAPVAVSFRAASPEGPITCLVSKHDDAFIVVMPIRLTNPLDELFEPRAWATNVLPKSGV